MIDHRLRVLRLVSEHGTVTAAAAALSYTPSAVSHQLRSLAAELGVVLLVPEGRGVRLTPAARVVLRHADDLAVRWELARAELAAVSGARGADRLRLCGFSTAAAALLPQVATAVRRGDPSCEVRIIEADPADCFDLLLADRADVAVVVATADLPPTSDPRFDQAPLHDDPLDLLVPAGHPLTRAASVPLAAAADERWVLDRPGRPHHQLVVTACAAAGFAPDVAHEAAEWHTGAALVDAGFGVALVPRLARLPSGYAITRVPLRGDPSPSRHVLTCVRRGSRTHPTIAAALAALRDAVRSLPDAGGADAGTGPAADGGGGAR